MFIFSPSSLFYPPYVISAIALTCLWLFLTYDLTLAKSLALICKKSVWLQRSTLVDLGFCILNLGVLHSLQIAFESKLFAGVLENLSWRSPVTFATSPLLEGLLATATTMLSIDLASYLAHRFMHRVPFLWHAHQLHHSAETLTPLTTYRQHPLELFFLNGTRTVAAGLGLSLLHGFFPNATPVLTIFGLGAGFFIYMFTVNLHHSMVPVHYPKWIRTVLVSPHIHHLHHSRNHWGCNYGVVFSVWDRMFGTYRDENVRLGELQFGDETSDHDDRSPLQRLLPASATALFLFGLFFFIGFLR